MLQDYKISCYWKTTAIKLSSFSGFQIESLTSQFELYLQQTLYTKYERNQIRGTTQNVFWGSGSVVI